MVVHTRSVHIAAPADRVYLTLVDPLRLLRYFPPVTEVGAVAEDSWEVTVGEGATAVRAALALDRDGPATRIGWAVRDSPYRGTVVVSGGPGEVDSIVTATVRDAEDPPDLDAELAQTHDPGDFGGSHGREALPVDALTADPAARPAVGDVLERALDHLRAYVESDPDRH
ncbi:SRPBCC family protein [Embleya sp. NPDC050493]|uniref:SRPBCC family protein n=1 Tax=Embleya sp. NPDC050493 TaxID=3363989 RepID=UPI0037A0CE37